MFRDPSSQPLGALVMILALCNVPTSGWSKIIRQVAKVCQLHFPEAKIAGIVANHGDIAIFIPTTPRSPPTTPRSAHTQKRKLDSRGIEPRTSPMLRENHTTRPQALDQEWNGYKPIRGRVVKMNIYIVYNQSLQHSNKVRASWATSSSC